MKLGGEQMSMASSSVSLKSGDGVADVFPAGLRVLVVDDDPTCLMILEKMLRNCLYEVTKCNRAEVALLLLRENKNGFDIVISDVHMPDMDGFKLLEHIGLEMDLPVIMMSADDSKNVVMKGVTHGACDYLIKPVRIEALRNIWQHVVRKRKHEWKDFEQSGSVADGERQQKPPEDADYSSSANEGNWRSAKRRKDEEDEIEDRDDTSSLKKPRVVWSVELHQQFVAAVNQLGIDKAVPKKILELMNVPGLTRENVASHLQKYRLYLRRLSGSGHQGGLNNSFMGNPEAAFGSLNGLDLQALAAAGQLPAHNLATLQAATLGRSTNKSAISMPLADQRNLFSFETPKLRLGDGQQQQLNNSAKQVNLLHGIPTNMDSKQLANLHQSGQPFAGMNMQVNSHGGQSSSILMPMGQPPSRSQIVNESNGNHVSRLQSSVGQPMLSNGIGGGILTSGVVDNVRGAAYHPVSQGSAMVDFSLSHNADLPYNSFPRGNNSGMSILTSKGVLHQEEAYMEMKGSRGQVPSYDIFNELHQPKSQDWGLQNVGLTFDISQQANIQGTLVVPQSVLVQQGFSSSQKTVLNRNSSIGKTMFSAGEESGRLNTSNIGQQLHSFMADNSQRVKTERHTDATGQNGLYSEQFGQDDIISALFKQQEDLRQAENEFGFDGYHLDNLPA
ncbi:hypothetical protein RJ639_020333 [Escallonia herrerae]|uniref:Two-component response regulator n=1 Tax=Escallonia herrerae TaxID=1293975 RepID=A0AA88V8C9_9ASTE|nr:hypothetical protein RJ639_020333 [Escallonia herrerae]